MHSLQGLFSSLWGGVGSGLGALLGGALMGRYGGQVLFAIMSVVVAGGWLITFATEAVLKARDRRQQQQ